MKTVTMMRHGAVGMLALALALAAFVGVPNEALAKNGNAWGHYKNPGNSAFGRSHNPHYWYSSQFRYFWDGHSFDTLDEYIAYLRSWIEERTHGVTDEAEVDVVTDSATSVGNRRATLRGTIDFNDVDEATVWFEYGLGTALTHRTAKVKLEDSTDERTFTRLLTDLEEGRRYSFRAVAGDEDGDVAYGAVRSFTTTEDEDADRDEAPTLSTLSAQEVEDDRANLRGSVDMRDFDNGTVFFVYGEDEDMIADVEDDFDTYDDIDESGDDLQKILIDTDLDTDSVYTRGVTGLDSDTTYYYAIGVEYEDEDGDDVLLLGEVRSFTTDE